MRHIQSNFVLSKIASNLLVLGLLTVTVLPTHASEVARVLFASGDAYIQQGTKRISAQKDMIVESGSTLAVERGKLQLRFVDGALLALKPNSQFRIDDYTFSPQDKSSNKAETTLVEGGLRTITGAVSKLNRDGYKMSTPTGTIGVRGTEYVVDGQLVTVIEGSIVVVPSISNTNTQNLGTPKPVASSSSSNKTTNNASESASTTSTTSETQNSIATTVVQAGSSFSNEGQEMVNNKPLLNPEAATQSSIIGQLTPKLEASPALVTLPVTTYPQVTNTEMDLRGATSTDPDVTAMSGRLILSDNVLENPVVSLATANGGAFSFDPPPAHASGHILGTLDSFDAGGYTSHQLMWGRWTQEFSLTNYGLAVGMTEDGGDLADTGTNMFWIAGQPLVNLPTSGTATYQSIGHAGADSINTATTASDAATVRSTLAVNLGTGASTMAMSWTTANASVNFANASANYDRTNNILQVTGNNTSTLTSSITALNGATATLNARGQLLGNAGNYAGMAYTIKTPDQLNAFGVIGYKKLP